MARAIEWFAGIRDLAAITVKVWWDDAVEARVCIPWGTWVARNCGSGCPTVVDDSCIMLEYDDDTGALDIVGTPVVSFTEVNAEGVDGCEELDGVVVVGTKLDTDFKVPLSYT